MAAEKSGDGAGSRFQRVAAELRSLLDSAPAEAVARARGACPSGIAPRNWDALRAGILVDAGAQLRELTALQEAESILRRLGQAYPQQATLLYNLANAIEAQSRLDATPYPKWYLSTSERRTEARRLLVAASDPRVEPDGPSRARTLNNLGNLLSHAYRWAEAYDSYVSALRADPGNGVAAGSAAQMLRHLLKVGIGTPELLDQLARFYASVAVSLEPQVRVLAGPAAVAAFRALPRLEAPWRPLEPARIEDPYLRFVAEHQLALSPTVEGFEPSERRWDRLTIGSLLIPPDAGPEVPAIFAMFNVLKADFAVARRLAFDASVAPHPDDGLYVDTLDFAVYGRRASLLTLAQRSALDVLDRVAVLMNDYLRVGVPPHRVQFTSFWFEGDGAARGWRTTIDAEIRAGNGPAVALADLAEDLDKLGALRLHRDARNAGTHRFAVLHDTGGGRSVSSEAVEHFEFDSYFSLVVATLQLARSAILYTAEFIAWRERRIRPAGVIGSLFAPSHHWVRGEDELPHRDRGGTAPQT